MYARNVDVEFRCLGGAKIPFLQIPHHQRYYDLIVFCLGSNDLAHGVSPHELYTAMCFYANQYVYYGFCPRVVIMSLFFRAHPFINLRINEFNRIIKLNSTYYIVGWTWSKKLRQKLQYDQVHLTWHSYHRAIRYLGSPMFYFTKKLL